MRTKLAINEIRIDGGTQARVRTNPATVKDYAAKMEDGVQFPPIDVFHDGADHWAADGFHRIEAHKKLGRDDIDVVLHDGDQRAARLFAIRSNKHGLKPTRQDKRNSVLMMLADPEWSQWTDREIAKAVDVSHPFVGKLRKNASGNVTTTDKNDAPVNDDEDDREDALECDDARDELELVTDDDPNRELREQLGIVAEPFDANAWTARAVLELRKIGDRWPDEEPIAPFLAAVRGYIDDLELKHDYGAPESDGAADEENDEIDDEPAQSNVVSVSARGERILALLREHGGEHKSKWFRDNTGMKEGVFKREIGKLLKSGHVKTNDGATNAATYSLPEVMA